MKEKNDCEIIQDLLPSYIDKLTNDKTNEYIESHIKDCEECKNVLENMKKELNINTDKVNKIKINYLKKYKNKLRNLKLILIFIFIVIFSILISSISRKMIIISNLYNKAEQYKNYKNYHITDYTFEEGRYIKSETFRLDDKVKTVITELSSDGFSKATTFTADKISQNDKTENFSTHVYLENENSKIACLNSEVSGEIDSYTSNIFYYKNIWELFKYSINISVKIKNIRGINCYYIENFKGSQFSESTNGIYVDKKTGLVICGDETRETRGTNKYRVLPIETIYEFDTVTEDEFIEPDISEYEVKESLVN